MEAVLECPEVAVYICSNIGVAKPRRWHHFWNPLRAVDCPEAGVRRDGRSCRYCRPGGVLPPDPSSLEERGGEEVGAFGGQAVPGKRENAWGWP